MKRPTSHTQQTPSRTLLMPVNSIFSALCPASHQVSAKETSIEILKFFQYLLLAFSYLVSRWSIACLELVCMPGLKQFAVIFEPFFFLWRCRSASNDHPESFSTSNQFREKKTPQKLGIPKNSKKKTTNVFFENRKKCGRCRGTSVGRASAQSQDVKKVWMRTARYHMMFHE